MMPASVRRSALAGQHIAAIDLPIDQPADQLQPHGRKVFWPALDINQNQQRCFRSFESRVKVLWKGNVMTYRGVISFATVVVFGIACVATEAAAARAARGGAVGARGGVAYRGGAVGA